MQRKERPGEHLFGVEEVLDVGAVVGCAGIARAAGYEWSDRG